MKTVAIEPALNNVREYLESQGLRCVEMQSEQAGATNAVSPEPGEDLICCIVTGADKNLMGMEDVIHNVPVISAEGMSPQQVYERVKDYVQ